MLVYNTFNSKNMTNVFDLLRKNKSRLVFEKKRLTSNEYRQVMDAILSGSIKDPVYIALK